LLLPKTHPFFVLTTDFIRFGLGRLEGFVSLAQQANVQLTENTFPRLPGLPTLPWRLAPFHTTGCRSRATCSHISAPLAPPDIFEPRHPSTENSQSGVAMPAAYFMAASSARLKNGLSDHQATMIAFGIEHD
jgi:hypothetical protein